MGYFRDGKVHGKGFTIMRTGETEVLEAKFGRPHGWVFKNSSS